MKNAVGEYTTTRYQPQLRYTLSLVGPASLSSGPSKRRYRSGRRPRLAARSSSSTMQRAGALSASAIRCLYSLWYPYVTLYITIYPRSN
jgi:hypothetical protein